jgi:pectin methylesterase-like acyl-CoA thioesterase
MVTYINEYQAIHYSIFFNFGKRLKMNLSFSAIRLFTFVTTLIVSAYPTPIIVAKNSGTYTTIQAGLSAANAGDTVFVKTGTYQETVIFGKSGTVTAPIVLRNFENDAPIID